MADVRLPELGENISGGDVLRVLVKPGDTLAKDQSIIEIETDKATVEVPSPLAGRVTAVSVKAGDKIKVGQAILTVDGGGAATPAPEPPAQSPAPPLPPSPPEPPDGTGVVASTPATIADVPGADRPSVRPAVARSTSPAPAAPSVRRLARELGVDINEVVGTGPSARISLDDVKDHTKRIVQGRRQAGDPAAAIPLPDFSRWGETDRQPMRAVRRTTAARVTAAWTTIPHVTQHLVADITRLEELRTRYAKEAEQAGGALTVTAIAIKVCAAALKVFPQFNAAVDAAADAIIYKKYVNIGVAVDTDQGLLVPVIKHADAKNIMELSVELSHLSEKARARKITIEEMQGGCFSISNLGGIGGTYFTPIINAPEVAILGISRARTEPVWKAAEGGRGAAGGEFVPRLMLPLSLSYDHRVIDGADGIRFLRWVAEALEQPFLLALEG